MHEVEPGILFNPSRVQRFKKSDLRSGSGGDRRDGLLYIYHDEDIKLAVNVALATKRPLLLSGPSGCGKSSLALNVALTLGRRFYEYVVTARSEARDLQWSFDTLRRLNDAQTPRRVLGHDQSYIEPGVLWWAIDPESAAQRGRDGVLTKDFAKDPSPLAGENAVLLIDEIDKADPDFPNNLLVPLGSLQFSVDPLRYSVTGTQSPLVFITTNRERELPNAFLRRCIAFELPALGVDDLTELAKEMLPQEAHKDDLFRRVAERVIGASKKSDGAAEQASTAEYLDTLKACIALNFDPTSEDYSRIERMTVQKPLGGRTPWD
jgi:MoxR-like ATPase